MEPRRGTDAHSSRALPRMLGILGVAAVVIVGAWGLASLLASRASERTSTAWTEGFGTWHELLETHPDRGANDEALHLEAVAARLGIDLAPNATEARERPKAEAAQRMTSVKKALGDYLIAQVERERAGFEPVPAGVSAYLARHGEALGDLRAALTSGSVPVWEQRLSDPLDGPVPNLLGHLQVHRVLLADALVRAEGGDREGAAADLEASWALVRSLDDSPILLSRLIGLAIARLQVGVLRHVGDVPPRWIERLERRDERAALLRALAIEGRWPLHSDLDLLSDSKLGPTAKAILGGLTRPYLRLSLADYSRRYQRHLDELAAGTPPCGPSDETLGERLLSSIPRWNVVGRIMAPDVFQTLDRAARYRLEAELTLTVLRLDARRGALGGRWPESLPEGASVSCADARWLYVVDEEGGMSLTLSEPPDWNAVNGPLLPMRYVAPARW